MKIATFHIDEENNIFIPKCIAVVWVGLQNNVPTIIATIGEKGERGKDTQFFMRTDGESVDIGEMQHQFKMALVNDNVEYLLFGEKPSVIETGPTPGSFVPPQGK